MSERIDSVLFDIKQSIDDFGYEIKLLVQDNKKLNEKIKILEEKELK